MGADGNVVIWRDDEVRAIWPDCDALFACIPTHYADTLDGTIYHHCYYGDGTVGWLDDYYVRDDVDEQRLLDFIDWLEANEHAWWEVWT